MNYIVREYRQKWFDHIEHMDPSRIPHVSVKYTVCLKVEKSGTADRKMERSIVMTDDIIGFQSYLPKKKKNNNIYLHSELFPHSYNTLHLKL